MYKNRYTDLRVHDHDFLQLLLLAVTFAFLKDCTEPLKPLVLHTPL